MIFLSDCSTDTVCIATALSCNCNYHNIPFQRLSNTNMTWIIHILLPIVYIYNYLMNLSYGRESQRAGSARLCISAWACTKRPSTLKNKFLAIWRRMNFHLQGGGMRRSGGYVDRRQRCRWKIRQVIWLVTYYSMYYGLLELCLQSSNGRARKHGRDVTAPWTARKSRLRPTCHSLYHNSYKPLAA